MTPKQQWYVIWLARGMTTTSAVMNPILYGLVNDRYRQAFKKLFTCRFTKEKMMAKSGAKSAGVDAKHDSRSGDGKHRKALSSVSGTTCVTRSATPTTLQKTVATKQYFNITTKLS